MNKFLKIPENQIRYQIISLVICIILNFLRIWNYADNIRLIVSIFLSTLLIYRLVIYSFVNNRFRKNEYREFYTSKKRVSIEIIYTLIVFSVFVYFLINSSNFNIRNNDDAKALIVVLSFFVIMTINVIIALKITKKYILNKTKMSDGTKIILMHFSTLVISLIGTIIMTIILSIILGSLGINIVPR